MQRGRNPVARRSLAVLGCSLVLGCVSSHPSTRAPSGPVYVDQRAPMGFRPPVRPPRPRKQPRPPALLKAFVRRLQPAVIPPPSITPSPPRPGCGYVIAGGAHIPLECAKADYGIVRSAGRPLVAASMLRSAPRSVGAAELPAAVDHRADGAEGPVRNQGNAGACSAFSFAAAVDHAVSRWTGQPSNVSALHVWARYHDPSMELPVATNTGKSITSEQVWPYNEAVACSWVNAWQCGPACPAPELCTCPTYHPSQCGRAVDPRALPMADTAPVAKVVGVTQIGTDTQSIMETLAKGQDVWFAMQLTFDAVDDSKLLRNHMGLPFVLPHFLRSQAKGAHAMVVSGYAMSPTGIFFLLHNSWGVGWADKGYAWIHETTLAENLNAAYVVEAEPWNGQGSFVPSKNQTASQCAAGLKPDSITGQCVPSCGDGSARHNGACADPNDCPAGYVNLYGECVVAAPSVTGYDPASQIRFACAPGGCTYGVTFGQYGCVFPECQFSCPSPRFRLTRFLWTFACSE